MKMPNAWSKPPFWEARRGGGDMTDLQRRYDISDLKAKLKEKQSEIDDERVAADLDRVIHNIISVNAHDRKAMKLELEAEMIIKQIKILTAEGKRR